MFDPLRRFGYVRRVGTASCGLTFQAAPLRAGAGIETGRKARRFSVTSTEAGA